MPIRICILLLMQSAPFAGTATRVFPTFQGFPPMQSANTVAPADSQPLRVCQSGCFLESGSLFPPPAPLRLFPLTGSIPKPYFRLRSIFAQKRSCDVPVLLSHRAFQHRRVSTSIRSTCSQPSWIKANSGSHLPSGKTFICPVGSRQETARKMRRPSAMRSRRLSRSGGSTAATASTF